MLPTLTPSPQTPVQVWLPRPPIYVRHGGLWYQLIAKATYLRRLRYQLIAKATYLVRRGSLRYQLVATATYLLLRLRFSSFSL